MEAFTPYWSFIAVSIAIYVMGMAAKRTFPKLLARWPGILAFWSMTMPAHPLIVGALAGLLPLPVPPFVGTALVARCAYFLVAGALCGQVYEAMRRATKVALRASQTPPPPDVEDFPKPDAAEDAEPGAAESGNIEPPDVSEEETTPLKMVKK